jgi:CRP-like cAMP-binding protein
MPPEVDLRVNRILSLLPADEFDRLAPKLTLIDGHHHDVLFRVGEPVEFAYFPITAVMSLIAVDADGRGVEMASVGREGLVGLPGALTGGGMVGDVIQQIAGRHARIGLLDLREEIGRHGVLSAVVERYTVALLSQIGQGVVCIRYHSLESRAARWLMASQDRAGTDDFTLTHDFLALMLGATRPQVTLVAGALKRAGLVEYKHGRVRILDRAGLEEVACECYSVIQAEFVRLLGDGGGHTWAGIGG